MEIKKLKLIRTISGIGIALSAIIFAISVAIGYGMMIFVSMFLGMISFILGIDADNKVNKY